MKAFFVIGILVLLSCSAKQEQKKAIQDDDWLTLYNADSARNDFAKGRCRILVYGLRAMQMPSEVNDSLNKTYHFTEFEAAGCEVTDEFINGAEEYNTEMYGLLDRLNGKGWKTRYDKTYDSLVTVYRKKLEREERVNDSLEANRRKADSLAHRKK